MQRRQWVLRAVAEVADFLMLMLICASATVLFGSGIGSVAELTGAVVGRPAPGISIIASMPFAAPVPLIAGAIFGTLGAALILKEGLFKRVLGFPLTDETGTRPSVRLCMKYNGIVLMTWVVGGMAVSFITMLLVMVVALFGPKYFNLFSPVSPALWPLTLLAPLGIQLYGLRRSNGRSTVAEAYVGLSWQKNDLLKEAD